MEEAGERHVDVTNAAIGSGACSVIPSAGFPQTATAQNSPTGSTAGYRNYEVRLILSAPADRSG
jgi:hypothetical protein